MKGLILAAGRGTRLRPLTGRRSKPLLPLIGQPLIAYPLQKLLYAGITEIGIVAGDNEDELRSGLSHIPADLSFIRQDEPLGLAHAVNCARGFCADDDFILLFCDNLFSEPLALAQAQWAQECAAVPDLGALIHTIEVDDPRAFGVAVVDEAEFVVELEEKPAQPKTNLAVIGIDFLTPSIFEAIGSKSNARKVYEEILRWEEDNAQAKAALAALDGKKLGGFSLRNGATGPRPNLLEQLLSRFRK